MRAGDVALLPAVSGRRDSGRGSPAVVVARHAQHKMLGFALTFHARFTYLLRWLFPTRVPKSPTPEDDVDELHSDHESHARSPSPPCVSHALREERGCGSSRSRALDRRPAAHHENCRAILLVPQQVAHRGDAVTEGRWYRARSSRVSLVAQDRACRPARGAHDGSSVRCRSRRTCSPANEGGAIAELRCDRLEGERALGGCNRSRSWEMLRRSIPTENWRGRRFL